jgi:hypothetical protein
MDGLRALRLTALDFWEESFIILGTGLVGGLLSLLLLPIPFVLAAHYGIADRLSDERVISWRAWLEGGRAHALFFYKWFLLAVFVSVVFLGNVVFYSRFDASWAPVMRLVALSLLLLWLLPQPFVPALYYRQSDSRLLTALRNAAILAFTDPFSALVVWLAALALAIPLNYIAWPFLLLLQVFVPFLSTRTTRLRLKRFVNSPPS